MRKLCSVGSVSVSRLHWFLGFHWLLRCAGLRIIIYSNQATTNPTPEKKEDKLKPWRRIKEYKQFLGYVFHIMYAGYFLLAFFVFIVCLDLSCRLIIDL